MRLAPLGLLLLLGCAEQPAQWTKPDLDPKALARDEEECEAFARAGRVMAKPAAAPGSMDRFQAEQDLRNECMTSRGYRR
jgi:hypothetical protein